MTVIKKTEPTPSAYFAKFIITQKNKNPRIVDTIFVDYEGTDIEHNFKKLFAMMVNNAFEDYGKNDVVVDFEEYVIHIDSNDQIIISDFSLSPLPD